MAGLSFDDRESQTWQQQQKWDTALRMADISEDAKQQVEKLLNTKYMKDLPGHERSGAGLDSYTRKQMISDIVQADLLSKARAQMQSTGTGFGSNSPLNSGGSLLARARA